MYVSMSFKMKVPSLSFRSNLAMNYWWRNYSSSFSFVLLLVTLVCAKDEDAPSKPSYVAPKFIRPTVVGNPLLVDWFEDSGALNKKWVLSRGKKDDVEDSIAKYNGVWEIGSPSKKVIDGDMGLIVKTQARHHAIAARLRKPFDFSKESKPMVAQYEVKYEDGQECGGGYLKALTIGIESKLHEFTDKTPYTFMFGPDKCGQDAKVHFIVRITNPKSGAVTEHHAKQPSKSLTSYFDDRHTHLYTLIIKPDDTFQVLVDNSEIMSGSLLTNLEPSITPPLTVDDPDDKKPADWDEREKIDDPDAKKPDDWDEDAPKEIEDKSAEKPEDWLESEPVHIPDPKATKPADWDSELDGEWEAPLIPNPACEGHSGCGPWKRPMIVNPQYKGKWTAPRIANPNYKGKWQPRQIENPNYFVAEPYKQLSPISAIGIELWTMSENIIIDNMYIGDSIDGAANFASQTFTIKHAQEEAYESAMSPDEGVVNYLLNATEERPWLWAVYVLCVLIPVIIIALVCFRRGKSTPSDADYKKTDEPQPDDEVPDLVGDDDEDERVSNEKEADKESGSETRERSKSPSRRRSESKSPSRKQKTTNTDDLDKEEDGIADDAVAGTSSPKGKRVRQRRQD